VEKGPLFSVEQEILSRNDKRRKAKQYLKEKGEKNKNRPPLEKKKLLEKKTEMKKVDSLNAQEFQNLTKQRRESRKSA